MLSKSQDRVGLVKIRKCLHMSNETMSSTTELTYGLRSKPILLREMSSKLCDGSTYFSERRHAFEM